MSQGSLRRLCLKQSSALDTSTEVEFPSTPSSESFLGKLNRWLQALQDDTGTEAIHACTVRFVTPFGPDVGGGVAGAQPIPMPIAKIFNPVFRKNSCDNGMYLTQSVNSPTLNSLAYQPAPTEDKDEAAARERVNATSFPKPPKSPSEGNRQGSDEQTSAPPVSKTAKRLDRSGQKENLDVDSHPKREISSENAIDFEDLILDRAVGRGAFGTVYKGLLHGELVAVKIISQMDSEPGSVPEFELLHGICHPNIVQIFAVDQRDVCAPGRDSYSGRDEWSVDRGSDSSFFTDVCRHLPRKSGAEVEPWEVWIMMEYCDRGSLWDAVKRGDFVDPERKAPDFAKSLGVCLEIAFAMQHLHEVGIIHGDLKPQNVLLQGSQTSPKNFVAKVGDFGLCRRPFDRADMTTFSFGTVDHMPPEMLQRGKLTTATDVFSYGMLLWELFSGKQPYKGFTKPAVMVAIVEGLRPVIPPNLPQSLAQLIKDCWQQNWRRRPSFGTIVARLKELMFSGFWRAKPLPANMPQFELVDTATTEDVVKGWNEDAVGEKCRVTADPQETGAPPDAQVNPYST